MGSALLDRIGVAVPVPTMPEGVVTSADMPNIHALAGL
jgi:hypothetical protein